MKLLNAILILAVILISCTTIKEVTNTVTETKIDTIYVVNQAWEDSVKGFWQDSLTVVGVFLDSLSNDTTVVVQYLPAKTKFIVKKYQDTVFVTRLDTVRITTVTLTEEPTFLEQWWWLFLIVAVVVLFVFVKR